MSQELFKSATEITFVNGRLFQVLEILKSTRSAANAGTSSKATALANKLLNKPGSLTSSVSIAPVKPGLTITKLGKQGEDDKATVTKAGKTKQKGKGK